MIVLLAAWLLFSSAANGPESVAVSLQIGRFTAVVQIVRANAGPESVIHRSGNGVRRYAVARTTTGLLASIVRGDADER
jgi:hypothetical protein